MSDSMRKLFGRGIADEVISLRNSLANHLGGTGIGLRRALRDFDKLNTDNAFDSGCKRPGDVEIRIAPSGAAVVGGVIAGPFGAFVGAALERVKFDVGLILPAWVLVRPRDHRGISRTLEGVLVKSKITIRDVPLKPWHTFYDWNFFVRVDPQYKYLLNESTRTHHSKNIPAGPGEDRVRDIIECEWDSAFLPKARGVDLPLWAIPQIAVPPRKDSRVLLVGRWIFDCGHPEEGHRTELHPVKAIVSFRSEAAQFEGNRGATRASNAVVYIGRRGGYIDQPINDQDYAFDLYLPPKPHRAAVPAEPTIQAMTGSLPVRPQITAFPENDPKLLRVVIPLKGVSTDPDEYGAIISAGWTDPEGTEASKVKRFRVTLDRIVKVGVTATSTWLFYVGVNGRWATKELKSPGSELNLSIEFALHQDDSIHVTACGFAIRNIHQFMGRESGVPSSVVSEASDVAATKNAAEKFASALVSFGDLDNIPLSFENDAIALFSKLHDSPVQRGRFRESSKDNPGPFEERSRDSNYVLEYSIQEV